MYGSDFYLNDDGDLVLTADNDLRTENTVRLIAQDIREEAATPYGSLPWDREAGSHLIEMVNDSNIDDDDILFELERLAFRDPRVDVSTVKAEASDDGKFRLTYKPLGTVPEESLLFDLNELLGENYE